MKQKMQHIRLGFMALLAALLVGVALCGLLGLSTQQVRQRAYADNEDASSKTSETSETPAAEGEKIAPLESKPQADTSNEALSGGTGGTIKSPEAGAGNAKNSVSGGSASHDSSTGRSSQNEALLGSSENQVNTHQVPDSSFIYDMSIVELAEADQYYDNQLVQVLGEVVGDRIYATGDRGHCWITLDVPNTSIDATIVVYMSSEMADAIDSFGEYGTTGTMLQVRGTYHLACSEHQGISDLHAEHVSIAQPGATHKDAFEFWRFLPGIALVALGGFLIVLYLRMREKER